MSHSDKKGVLHFDYEPGKVNVYNDDIPLLDWSKQENGFNLYLCRAMHNPGYAHVVNTSFQLGLPREDQFAFFGQKALEVFRMLKNSLANGNFLSESSMLGALYTKQEGYLYGNIKALEFLDPNDQVKKKVEKSTNNNMISMFQLDEETMDLSVGEDLKYYSGKQFYPMASCCKKREDALAWFAGFYLHE